METDQRYFKFLDQQYIPNIVVDGIVRFGHFDYYRLLEAVFQDKTIGDLHEGRAETDLSNITMVPGNKDPNLEAILKQVGLGGAPETTVIGASR